MMRVAQENQPKGGFAIVFFDVRGTLIASREGLPGPCPGIPAFLTSLSKRPDILLAAITTGNSTQLSYYPEIEQFFFIENEKNVRHLLVAANLDSERKAQTGIPKILELLQKEYQILIADPSRIISIGDDPTDTVSAKMYSPNVTTVAVGTGGSRKDDFEDLEADPDFYFLDLSHTATVLDALDKRVFSPPASASAIQTAAPFSPCPVVAVRSRVAPRRFTLIAPHGRPPQPRTIHSGRATQHRRRSVRPEASDH